MLADKKRQLVTSVRTKRSVDAQNGVFLPVYAQISRKAMHRMCLQKRYNMKELEGVEKTTPMTSPRKSKAQRFRVRSERKLRSLNNSEPKSIATLPYPFHGTDNTVFNDTAYYNYGDMLIAYNLKNGETKELRLNISTSMLYNNSNSRMDVQADEHGIWVLYRRKGEDYMTASRVQPISLKA
ncbi:hypothetical protein NECAME_11960 [Necator americanus]|uniref:Olfactomedin-like domain-containing protein n=1 Tax=Necator americanus TaxID=51031 RepID=W2T2E1_NECAM|nr:hypothetical protein NECAME_11960 [Necator americanus]ETN76068.1 hypothetical protein NECAME_11960 [Necator americanus]